jgi:phenylalanyl-tRNA synthetase beta chain
LLTGLLSTLARNVGRGHTDVALYEVGPVFRSPVAPGSMPRLVAGRRPTAADMEQLEAALPVQPQHLGVALCGDREPAGWWGRGRAASWSDAVEAVRTAAGAVGVSIDVTAAAVPPWHPGRCAALSVAGRPLGYAGELHPRVVEALGLPPRTCAAEVDLGEILAAAPEVVTAPPMSAYPPATLDVAVVVAADVPVAAVAQALRDGAGSMIEQLRLFDVYTGDQIGPGRKSLAFALRFRAPDRTLTVEEAVAARDAAVAEAARRVGAVLRG